MTVPTTTQVVGSPPEVLDAYAGQVEWARALVGDPGERTLGSLPRASFDLAEGGRLVVATGGGVMLRLETPATAALDHVVLDGEDHSA